MKSKKRIKVLQFSQLINRFDFMDVIIRHANSEKYEISACTMTSESNILLPHYDLIGKSHFDFDLPFTKSGMFAAIFRLAALVRREKIDIVHAHHYYECIIASIALIFCRKASLIVGRHYHNELYLTTKGIKLKVYLFLEKFVNWRAKFIISPSSQISQLLLDQGVSPDKILKIHYGFDFTSPKYTLASDEEILQVKKSLSINANEILIGNFGRHHPIKGQDEMIKVFKRLLTEYSNIKLLMVGDGPFNMELKRLVGDLKIADKVLFVGWQRDINPYLSAVDLVWHPTHQEAFPQIMIESMALCKPLFITPVSGATDIIEDGKNGFILDFGKTDLWLDLLIQAFNDPNKLKKIGMRGRKTVLKKLNIEKIINQFEVAYDS